MRLDRLAPLGLGVLAAAMIVGGLMVVGGPEAARREKHDLERVEALARLAGCVRDLPQETFDALPEVMTEQTACADFSEWRDPHTDEPFRIQRDGGTSYRLCATFEKPEKVNRSFYDLTFDRKTGCVAGHRPG